MGDIGKFSDAFKDRCVPDMLVPYLEARSKGGAGLIISEGFQATRYGNYLLLGAYEDRFIPGMEKYRSAIHAHGAVAFLQIYGLGGKDMAKAAGYPGPQSWTLGGTFAMVPLAIWWAPYAMYSTYLGGEIKRGGLVKTHFASMFVGGLLSIVGLHIVLWLIMSNTVSPEFIGASSYLYFMGGSNPIPAQPFYFTFSLITVGRNLPLLTLLFVGYLLTIWHVPALDIIMPTRCIFSYAFDRLAPEKFSEVSTRFRIPVWPVLLSTVIGWFFLLYLVLNPTSLIWLGTPAAFSTLILLGGTSVAGMVFPWRLKSMFENSPANIKVRGVPLISIGGVISLGVMIWAFNAFYLNPTWTGYTWSSWIILAVLYGGAIAYYHLVRSYRRRQGLDLDLIFKQIPPE